jgi:ABC-2 type transport system ATP-binding protein
VVLVTHEMAAVESYCHRAMLISDGQIQHVGEPAEIGREYLKLNFASEQGEGDSVPSLDTEEADGGARLLSCQIVDAAGEERSTLERGEPIRFQAEVELLRDVPGLHIGFVVATADDVSMFEVSVPVASDDGHDLKGDRVTVTAEVENPLAAGRHFIHCGIQSPFGISVYSERVATFVIYGDQTRGIIAPEYEYEAEIVGGEAA